jgi:hypothetical protein
VTGPQITLARKSGITALVKRVAGITKLAAYVGIPAASTRERQEILIDVLHGGQGRKKQLLAMADKTRSKKKKAQLIKAAAEDVTNAELLYIFSKGSPMRKQLARPVLEPAIEADGNRQPISAEINASLKASLAGDKDMAVKKMRRAAIAGQNAARSWFTDSRNSWAPLAESTKRGRVCHMTKAQQAEAEDLGDAAFTPGVDTGAMRAAIVGVTREE